VSASIVSAWGSLSTSANGSTALGDEDAHHMTWSATCKLQEGCDTTGWLQKNNVTTMQERHASALHNACMSRDAVAPAAVLHVSLWPAGWRSRAQRPCASCSHRQGDGEGVVETQSVGVDTYRQLCAAATTHCYTVHQRLHRHRALHTMHLIFQHAKKLMQTTIVLMIKLI
jgi:hypothetical protein